MSVRFAVEVGELRASIATTLARLELVRTPEASQIARDLRRAAEIAGSSGLSAQVADDLRAELEQRGVPPLDAYHTAQHTVGVLGHASPMGKLIEHAASLAAQRKWG